MRRLIAIVSVLAIGGCGYSFVTAGAVPSDVRRIAVEVSASPPADPGLVDALAREIRQELRSHGRFETVAAGQGAVDATLEIEVLSDRARAVAFDETDDVLDYQLTLALDATLRRRGGEVLWSATRISATRGHAAVPEAVVTSSATFQADQATSTGALERFDTVQLGEERRSDARRRAVRDVARAVYERMSEGL